MDLKEVGWHDVNWMHGTLWNKSLRQLYFAKEIIYWY
jgi:hypothetical protein